LINVHGKINGDGSARQCKARIAGFLYLLIVVLGFYGIMYVPS
jgi:hypothetical protein